MEKGKKKKSDGKGVSFFLSFYFLRQKSLFDRGNIKIGTILASSHKATVGEFDTMGKWFVSPEC